MEFKDDIYFKYGKRAFDILISSLGIAFLFIPLTIIAIFVKFSSPGPVLYRQIRIGQGGCKFRVNKFRTMYSNHKNISTITVAGDIRVTKAGKILRLWKLDELPQLFNIFAGTMSFVGPRPDVPGYWDKLEGEGKKVLALRPGITGPATVKYANEEEILANVDNPKEYNDEVIFPDKVKLNIEYMKNCSLIIDLKYIVNTLLR